ncbi:MAG: DUF4197 domain-containing protein [Litorimonas sp.]
MDRRIVLLGLASTPLAACETLDPSILDGLGGLGGALTAGEVALGLKAALDNGVGNALSNVGVLNGFLGNDIVRIPLPKVLQDVQSVLAPLGADKLLVELQTQLNRGAEKAAPVAQDIFLDAVKGLTITDAFDILRGTETAATEYLQARTTTRLGQLFSPIMENALNQTGALRLVDDVSSQLRSVPFGPNLGADARNDLVAHGVDYGLRGVFHFIGEEEKAIRANPAKRTSEILRRVFGA